jgi:hypothetical protein
MSFVCIRALFGSGFTPAYTFAFGKGCARNSVHPPQSHRFPDSEGELKNTLTEAGLFRSLQMLFSQLQSCPDVIQASPDVVQWIPVIVQWRCSVCSDLVQIKGLFTGAHLNRH